MAELRRNPVTRRALVGRVSGAAALFSVLLSAPSVMGYPYYDDGVTMIGDGAGCVDCHNQFAGGSGALHGQHRNEFGVANCNLCHPSGGSTKPVGTSWSGPGGGFGCAGCHGRDYGETSPLSGQPKATAYGLRQVHADYFAANSMPNICANCHQPGALGHGNPFPTVLGEDELPPYFNPTFSNLTDSCSSAQEDIPFDLDSLGLDNDGDGARDGADSDCFVAGTPTATPTPTSTPTATVPFACGASPTGGCIAPGKAVLLVNEKKTDKEKMKVVLKKMVPAVAAADFGDPATGPTAYKVCIYDGADVLSGEYTVDQSGAICDGLSCWSKKGDKGYKYKDKAMSADGVLKMVLFGGDAGKGKAIVKAKNKTSKLPLGVAAALQDETSATVQLLTSDAQCFGTSLARVKKADGLIFKALNP